MQNLQSQTNIELAELEAQQIVEPPLEVSDVMLDIQCFGLVL